MSKTSWIKKIECDEAMARKKGYIPCDNRLPASGKRDVLFWQEPVGDEIPWNMQMILRGKARRTAEVMVQRRTPYEKLMELGADAGMVHRLGLVYRFRRENGYKPEALICTNSENVEHCREIVSALPEIGRASCRERV